MYQAAKAATEGLFNHHMNAVKNLNVAAYDKLMATPHNTWANYACRKNVIWDQTTSNMAESVNNMIGTEVRFGCVLYHVLHDFARHNSSSTDVLRPQVPLSSGPIAICFSRNYHTTAWSSLSLC